MIQRIQSLYLLIVTILISLMLFSPLGYFTFDGAEYRLTAFRAEPVITVPAPISGSVPENTTHDPFITEMPDSVVMETVPDTLIVADPGSTAPDTLIVADPTATVSGDRTPLTGSGYIITGLLIVLAALWPLITLFLYRRRRVQAKFCLAEIALLLLVQAAVIFHFVWIPGCDAGEPIIDISRYTLADILPLIGIVFAALAYRAINRDEALVRSLDRIR